MNQMAKRSDNDGVLPPKEGGATPSTVLKIRSLLPSLAPAEQRVAQRIIDDPEGVANSSITQLARDCDTSEATVIRFCRTIDFAGYRELRLRLASEAGQARGARGSVQELTGDINPDDTLVTVVQKIAYADARAVEDTGSQLDIETLQRVIELLDGARRIDIYGVGASAFVASDFQQKLHRIGMISHAWTDAHAMLTSAAVLRPGDVAVGISHSGSTSDTVGALAEARRKGASTIRHHELPALTHQRGQRPHPHHRSPRDHVPLRSYCQPSRPVDGDRLRVRRPCPTALRRHPGSAGSHLRGGAWPPHLQRSGAGPKRAYSTAEGPTSTDMRQR